MTGGVALRVLFLGLLVSGCASLRPPPAPVPVAQVEFIEDPVPVEWRNVITPADEDRLARAEDAWRQGLAAAARFRTAIRNEGPLLDPEAALARAAPSPGPYHCRIVRLGGRPAFAAFKTFDCFVDAEGQLLTMVKATGTQRPAGRLWTDNDTRMVFLGALSAGSDVPPPYGAKTGQDVAGYFERIGPFRWRLVVPFPQGGEAIEIYELIPAVPAS